MPFVTTKDYSSGVLITVVRRIATFERTVPAFCEAGGYWPSGAHVLKVFRVAQNVSHKASIAVIMNVIQHYHRSWHRFKHTS